MHITQQPAVRLIGALTGPDTGLSRYGKSLRQALAELGLPVETATSVAPRIPGPLLSLAGKLGFDLPTFFANYPLALPAAQHRSITHLISQNLASAVIFEKPFPLLVTAHDIITLAYRNDPEITGYMKFYDKVFDNLTAIGLKRADHLIADSASTRRDLERFLGIPRARISVIHLGIDHATFRLFSVPDEFFARYRIDRSKRNIVYVGSEDPRKNLKRLIDALARVRQSHPEIMLLKVGDARFGEERRKLMAYAETRGMLDRIQFVGQVSNADLACFYSMADLLVFPSLYEGFGFPPLEAMACGTPVISSNASSLPEIVGDAALQVNPYDVPALAGAIDLLLDDPHLHAELRVRGLAHVAQFTWERTARETLAVYQTLLHAQPAAVRRSTQPYQAVELETADEN